MTDRSTNTKIKLRVPEACRAITLGNAPLPIEPDGSLETDAATATALEAHGAVPWQDEASPAEIATLSREKLAELFMTRTRAALEAQDTETIRASLLDVDVEDTPPVTRDTIARLGRKAVVDFLQQREIVMPAQASLADLRARAVATLDA